MEDEISNLLDIAAGYFKDKRVREILDRVAGAQREYLLAEAEERRKKCDALIRAIGKLDMEKLKLQRTMEEMKGDLSEEAYASLQKVIDFLEKQRAQCVMQKKRI